MLLARCGHCWRSLAQCHACALSDAEGCRVLAEFWTAKRFTEVVVPYLIDFVLCNFRELFANDVLHQDKNGMCKHILDCVEVHLSTANYKEFNRRLQLLRALHNAVIPSQGYAAMKMTAEVRFCGGGRWVLGRAHWAHSRNSCMCRINTFSHHGIAVWLQLAPC